MTTYRTFNSLLLNELLLISNRLDEIRIKQEETSFFSEEHKYYTFMVELLNSNLELIQKKIKSRNIEQNKKIAFIHGRQS